jgi:nucleoside-diphosphate-sugar epimerase
MCFVTGGTGYIGRALIELLVARGHTVAALVRPESTRRLPSGVAPIVGDALDASTFAAFIARSTTLVHLVGTPHPDPSKAAEFQRVDLGSICASVDAGGSRGSRALDLCERCPTGARDAGLRCGTRRR